MTNAPTGYLGFRFFRGSRAEAKRAVDAAAGGSFGYVVTPNVDFITRAAKDPDVAALYDGAALQFCDSRVLSRIARLRGVTLDVHPGSDLVADLFASGGGGYRIALVGPTPEDVAALRGRYPAADITLIETPRMMTVGDDAWKAAVSRTVDSRWDIALLCLGSPKQERFAQALAAGGRATGVALCVGASIDFLTGSQRRAPLWLQQAGLEWLHRLATNPRRLWRRYLVDGPRIFLLAFRKQ